MVKLDKELFYVTPVFLDLLHNIIIGINESVRGKTSRWILIYLRITTISTTTAEQS